MADPYAAYPNMTHEASCALDDRAGEALHRASQLNAISVQLNIILRKAGPCDDQLEAAVDAVSSAATACERWLDKNGYAS